MAEAAELAKNTAIYNQVGFLNNIDTATEHLVSTLKAFNIDANESLGVIDALDSVGKMIAHKQLYRLKTYGKVETEERLNML